MNRQIVLAARPEGLPKPSDFRLVETPVPQLTKGQFLVKTHYLSVDPYMRGRISEARSYAEPVQIGQVMGGGTVGTVVELPGGLPQGNRRLLRQRGRAAHRRRVHADQRRGADRHLRPDRPIQRHPAAARPALLWHLIVKQARAEGFLVFQFANRFREGQQQVAQWIKEGKVKYQETIVNGLEYAPTAFIGLFHGENVGKQLVWVAKGKE